MWRIPLGVGAVCLLTASIFNWSGDAAAGKSGRAVLVEDAGSPFQWCDWAEYELEAGEAEQAEYAVRRAMELGPRVPAVWIRAGNLHYQTGRINTALREYARVLSMTPEYDAFVFATVERMGVGTAGVLEELRGNGRGMRAYLEHRIGAKDLPGAAAVWAEMTRDGYADERSAVRYVNALAEAGEYAAAAKTWREQRPGGYARGGLVFNGGFEAEPSGAVLDWRLHSYDGVDVARDANLARSGKSSLRVRFPGDRNVSWAGAVQDVFVPNATGGCEVRAWVKTDGITTDEGPRLRVVDGGAEVASESWRGNGDWREIVLPVRAGAKPGAAHAIRIEVLRRASRKLDHKVAGTVWVDDVRVLCSPR